MSGFMIFLPIVIALVLYFTGIPIAYALMTATLSFFTFIDTTSHPYLLMQKFITSTQSFPFLAIPSCSGQWSANYYRCSQGR